MHVRPVGQVLAFAGIANTIGKRAPRHGRGSRGRRGYLLKDQRQVAIRVRRAAAAPVIVAPNYCEWNAYGLFEK